MIRLERPSHVVVEAIVTGGKRSNRHLYAQGRQSALGEEILGTRVDIGSRDADLDLDLLGVESKLVERRVPFNPQMAFLAELERRRGTRAACGRLGLRHRRCVEQGQ